MGDVSAEQGSAEAAGPRALCNCLALRQAARHVTAAYDAVLAPYGLRTTQFSILTRLSEPGPQAGAWSIHALAARMVMDRTTLGRNIRPLAREGLLRIGPAPHDRRLRALTLTPKGADRVREAQPAWRRAQAAFDTAYGPERAVALRALLAEVCETALTEGAGSA